MCGIAGIISGQHYDSIFHMTRALLHRGPDESGYYHSERISLGQKRLSIIDLHTGKQPISNEADNIFLICNGEIYNSPDLRKRLIASGHRFKTQTDVEVILHLYEDYGKDCVKHLRGMFAFAIWEEDKRTLLLARDHLGQKPLFFCGNKESFAFASEPKGILASKIIEPEIDINGLWHYTSLRYLPDCYSMFNGIQKLPAASMLVYKNNKIDIEKYWELYFSNKLQLKEDEIIDGLDALLFDTIKMHLLSDVQVGSFLSGGMDSSIITAMMASITNQTFPTFSIGVEEQDFNELPYAKMVVDRYGLKGHEQVVRADLINLIPSMTYHMDEPADPFAVGVYLVSQLASKTVKVVLSGDGGDENFAGYDRFVGNQLINYYNFIPSWIRNKIVGKLIGFIPESFSYKSLAQKAAWVHEMSKYDDGERYAQSLGFLRFTHEAKEQLFSRNVLETIEDYDSSKKVTRYFDSDNAEHLIDKMLYTDLMTRMPDHLLTLVDRMTMAHSLESRAPLIDHKVVEYAASIPTSLKLKGNRLKYLLRKLSARYLPEELVNRKKVGFGFPLGMWMRTDLKPFIVDLLRQSRFIELGIFDRQYVNHILEEHMSGRADHNYRIWLLINLEIWYKLYFENESVESISNYIRETTAVGD